MLVWTALLLCLVYYLSAMEATILWGGLTSISNLSRLSNEKKRFLPATINLLLTENACNSSREGSLRISANFTGDLGRQFVCLFAALASLHQLHSPFRN